MQTNNNNSNPITRREFIWDGSVASLGLTAGLALLGPRRAGAGNPNAALSEPDRAAIQKTRSYHPDVEYRRLGKTGLWVSAVSLGGHWKRIDKVIGAKGDLDPYVAPTDANLVPAFEQNRLEVVNRCLEVGINWIDFAGDSEPEVYSKVLRGQREKVFIGYSHPASELRVPENRTAKKLLELFEAGLQRCGLEYVDLWRLMVLERGGRHTPGEVEEMVQALVTARQQGKCRFNPAITAPIPGLISIHQVDNMALAIKERHELDFAERRDLDQINREMWANLAPEYQWLKEWEYV